MRLPVLVLLALAFPGVSLGATGQAAGKVVNPAVSGNASASVVTATGSTSARPLKDRFADVVNVRDFGAKGDGSTDETSAVAAAYAALGTTGGTIQFPPGNYKFNLTVAKNGVYLRGAGSSYATGSETGTRFRAANAAIPVVQFGNGTTSIYFGGISGVAIFGDGTNATGDGIYVYGAFFLDFNDISVHVFGRDNIRVTSSATAASSFIHFRKLVSRAAVGSSFKAVYGGSYTTAVFLSDTSLMDSTAAGARALYLDGTTVTAATTYMDVHDAHGVYLTGSAPRLIMNDCYVDAGNSNAAIVELNEAPTTISQYLTGKGRIYGKVKWNDASLSASLYAGTDFATYPRIYAPYVGGTISFGDASDIPTEGYGITSAVRMYRVDSGGQKRVELTGSTFRPDLTYTNPLQGSGGGALWRNATTMQLRWQTASIVPASDTAGVPLSTFVSVPASAAATCNPGEWSADASFAYFCHAANTWKRVAIATW